MQNSIFNITFCVLLLVIKKIKPFKTSFFFQSFQNKVLFKIRLAKEKITVVETVILRLFFTTIFY